MINSSRLWLIVLVVAAISHVGCGRLDKFTNPQATMLSKTPTSQKSRFKNLISQKLTTQKSIGQKLARRKPKSLSRHQKQDIQLALAEAAESSGDIEQAIRTYEKFQSEQPEIILRLANLYVKQGQNERATEKYRQAIRLGADTPEVFSDFGYNLYLLQQYEEAEKQLKTALKLRPDFPRANNNLGLLYARLGRTHEALDCFARAGLTESDARANLALALLSEQNTSDAVAELDTAKALDRTGKSAERIASLARIVRAVRDPNRVTTVGSDRATTGKHEGDEVSLASFRK